MKVKMLENAKGCNDGINVVSFEKDEVYEVPKQISKYLAGAYIERGIAEEVGASKPAGKTDEQIAKEKEEAEKLAKEQAEKEAKEKEEAITEAKKILDKDDLEEADVAKLKEIGVKLQIAGMVQTKDPAKIVEKIKKELEAE